ncbi:hypothetical protein JXD38_07415 [candidate division WOR-3 bacterium]|nr:hypothetical protein [candidate division WOR-3 bacterium]
MRNRWLLVIAVASLCLNVAVVGTYFLRRTRLGHPRRFPARHLTAEARERIRKTREAALPEFTAEAERVRTTDSLLWSEMQAERPDSARVESLCRELGEIHGRMRAMVFRQMHRELQLMPVAARTEYLHRMMTMRPRLDRPGRGARPHMHRRSMMQDDDEPVPGEPPPGPPESGD